MYKSWALLVFSIVLVFRPIKTICNFFPLSMKDRITVGGVFRTNVASSWLECLVSCSYEPSCVAYNYVPCGETLGHCEMSACGTKHGCFSEKGEVSVRGHITQQIRPSQVARRGNYVLVKFFLLNTYCPYFDER